MMNAQDFWKPRWLDRWLRRRRYRRGVLAGTTFNLDGEQMRVYYQLAPLDCDEGQNVQAFAVLVGAAAACATRMSDELDLGRDLPETEREEWLHTTLTLLHLADLYTPGSDATREELLYRTLAWRQAIREQWRAQMREAGRG